MLSWQTKSAPTASMLPMPLNLRSDAAPATDPFDQIGTCMLFERNAEIFAENEPAEDLYRVVSGAVRTCNLMSDGRRHIGAFYLPGDLFGLEASASYRFSAEAVRDSRLLVVGRRALLARAAADREVWTALWDCTLRHLQRAQNHMLLLGRKCAQERLAAFLLEMAERLPGGGAIELPMSRQDIADYLGLTIETVSRTLTQMERDRIVEIPAARLIELRNRNALVEMNDRMAA